MPKLSPHDRPMALVVSNALDDATRVERRISTDSPAASRKVFQLAQALRLAGVRPYVLSLGRGRADGSGLGFAAKTCRVDRVPTVYAPFSHSRGWSELLSLFGLLRALYRLSSCQNRVVIFYNRMPAYLIAMKWAAFLGYRCFLDLEDGEVLGDGRLKQRFYRWLAAQFDRHCIGGALLACSALASMTSVRPVHCYYGTARGSGSAKHWRPDGIKCLMSGTLSPDTGAPMLVKAIQCLRARQPGWAKDVTFEITGMGESLSAFERLADEPGLPLVRGYGRTNNARYPEVRGGCDVGLALKPVSGVLADTTFPSKVIEFAGAVLLVLSTDISDVRRVLGSGARYLERNDPELLIERLAEIACDRGAAAYCANQGRAAAERYCSPQQAGNELREFLFGRAT